jgi:DNA-binding Xre family transcriptional regulator
MPYPKMRATPLGRSRGGFLKNGRAKAGRLVTLDALCEALECQPGDILTWEPAPKPQQD